MPKVSERDLDERVAEKLQLYAQSCANSMDKHRSMRRVAVVLIIAIASGFALGSYLNILTT